MNTSCVANCIFHCVYRGKRMSYLTTVFNFWGKTGFFAFQGSVQGTNEGFSFFCVFIFSLHKPSKPTELVIFDLICTKTNDKTTIHFM